MGVVIGSGIGGIRSLSEQFRILYERGPSESVPSSSPRWCPTWLPVMFRFCSALAVRTFAPSRLAQVVRTRSVKRRRSFVAARRMS